MAEVSGCCGGLSGGCLRKLLWLWEDGFLKAEKQPPISDTYMAVGDLNTDWIIVYEEIANLFKV